MKVNVKQDSYKPVTITLETPEELAILSNIIKYRVNGKALYFYEKSFIDELYSKMKYSGIDYF